MSVTEMFKMELKNSKNNDYNLIILIKKYMKNGELYLENLNSKQRSFLHKFAQKYNLDHYSIGNYNNRILVLKDNQHICFDKVYPYKFQNIIEKYSEKQGYQINYKNEEDAEYEDDEEYEEYEANDEEYDEEYDEDDEEYDEEEYNKDDEDDEDDEEYDDKEQDDEDSDYQESECEYQSGYSAGTLSKLTYGEKVNYVATLINIGLSLIIYSNLK